MDNVLKNRKRKNVALFVALLENEFSISVIEGAVKGAEEIDANLIVFPIGLIDGAYRHKKYNIYRYQYNVMTAFLKANSIDAAVIEYGTIASAIDENRKKEFLSQFGDIPVYLLSESARGYKSICIDNKVGLEETINHIIHEHGCRKIGFLSGPKNNQDAKERLNVYKRIMEENELDCSDRWIAYGNFSIYSENEVNELLDKNPDIEAIVCANDHMAIGAYNALKARNLLPGKDILVTGFDNIPSSILVEPPLTTVKADPSQLSYNALLAIDNKIEVDECMYIPTYMVARESCGCVMQEPGVEDENQYSYLNHVAREKVIEAERRKQFEVELGNNNREMLSLNENEDEWFESTLHITKKMNLGDSYIFLYDKSVKHKANSPWIQPKSINLRGSCKGGNIKVYSKDEYPVILDDIFDIDIIQKEDRYNLIVTPLFFRENQYGYMIVENTINYFQFAFQMANQISTSLEMVYILNAQERIKQELEYANNSKSQFLANMSHEIRTPINAILGMNEMILRENSDTVIDGYALNIKNAANTLLSIVNDILDFSKIEAGKMSIIPVDYNIATLVNELTVLMVPKAEEKHLKLEINCDGSLPKVLKGDDVRIKQVLMNLLSNAVKYTEKGTVSLTVSAVNHGDYADMTFKVADTGIGIKQEDLIHLFEKFERIEERRNRNIEGTGLGMNITIGLLSLMGSSLDVNSVYGKGSEFSFTLRQDIVDSSLVNITEIKIHKEEKKIFKQKFKAKDAKILVVDDIDINRVIIASLLSQSDIIIEEAASGKNCLEMVSSNSYDLILLDHMMPEMDGLETLANIRRLHGCDYASLPVIALTANAIAGSEKMYLDAGFNDYLSKPVDPDELDNMIIKHLPAEKIIYDN